MINWQWIFFNKIYWVSPIQPFEEFIWFKERVAQHCQLLKRKICPWKPMPISWLTTAVAWTFIKPVAKRLNLKTTMSTRTGCGGWTVAATHLKTWTRTPYSTGWERGEPKWDINLNYAKASIQNRLYRKMSDACAWLDKLRKKFIVIFFQNISVK